MEATPTYGQLGVTLRTFSSTARRLGDANRWRPNPDSAEAAVWRTASSTRDPLSLTLVEADVHAVLLVRSALVHVDEVGRAISSRQPLIPLSAGRVTLEHALRALYLTDEDLSPTERAEHRLDDLLYAITESGRRRHGAAKIPDVDADQIVGVDDALANVKMRAQALGLTFTATKKGNRVSQRGRPSTMRLAEHYLSGEHSGVLEFLLRGHSAIIHGIETALLASAVDDFDPATGLNMPTPGLADPAGLAFELLGIPPALDNAFRSVASRFDWPPYGKAWRKFDQARAQLLKVWTRAVDQGTETDARPTLIDLFNA